MWEAYMPYVRPAVRLDRMKKDLGDPRLPVLVTGFAQAIRDHEHQIADLVLSICARALSNGTVSLEEAVQSLVDPESGQRVDPRDLLVCPHMQVNVVDSGVFADMVMTTRGAPKTSLVAERILQDMGWQELQHYSTLVGSTPQRAAIYRSSLWSPRRSFLHRSRGLTLWSQVRALLEEQVAEARVLALPHVYWLSAAALKHLLDLRGQLIQVPDARQSHGRGRSIL